jgi:hypothetical protein
MGEGALKEGTTRALVNFSSALEMILRVVFVIGFSFSGCSPLIIIKDKG